MSIEEKVGKISGHVEDIKEDIKILFDKIGKVNEEIDERLISINSQHDYEQKQTNEYLKSIDLKVAGIKQPCSDVKVSKDKIETHLKDHKERQRNNLGKIALFTGLATLALRFLGFAWGKIIKLLFSY